MFTAIEYRQIYSRCPDKISELLEELNISAPHWSKNEEGANIAELDNNISDKLSRLMESESVIDGYMTLLSAGGIDYEISEPDYALLKKIVDNQTEISEKIKSHYLKSRKKNSESVKPEYDYSKVECKLYLKKDNVLVKHLPGSYGIETYNEELAQKIRDFISDYWQRKFNKSVVGIDIYIKSNDEPPRMKRIMPNSTYREEAQPLPKDIDKTLKVLNRLNEIIQAIEE